jgi:hypothetical protein
VAAASALLYTLPAPSTNRVGEVYQWLKSNLGTTATHQVESSLQHRVEASILPPAHPKGEGQRAAQGTLNVGTASSPVGFSACNHLSRLGALKYTDNTAHGTMTHSPSSACETHTVGPVMITKDVTSILKGLA